MKETLVRDPKGFFRIPAPCLAGESCQPRRTIARKTFRVFKVEPQNK